MSQMGPGDTAQVTYACAADLRLAVLLESPCLGRARRRLRLEQTGPLVHGPAARGRQPGTVTAETGNVRKSVKKNRLPGRAIVLKYPPITKSTEHEPRTVPGDNPMNARPQDKVWLILSLWFILGRPVSAGAAQTSDLWGLSGEKWTPQSRLPDFSFAGYHCGETPLPALAPGVSVKDFGAKGDGVTDDTQSFLDALAKAKTGAIEIPPGRYKITKILEITRPGLVLRGAGADRTFLFFPVPLNDIQPKWSATTEGRRTSDYSWAGGMVWFRGTERGQALATVTAGANRGDTSLKVSSTNRFKPGQRIQIFLTDAVDKSLTAELYSGDPGNTTKMSLVRVSLVTKVTRVETGEVHFDRPLRWEVKLAWQPRISAFDAKRDRIGRGESLLRVSQYPLSGPLHRSRIQRRGHQQRGRLLGARHPHSPLRQRPLSRRPFLHDPRRRFRVGRAQPKRSAAPPGITASISRGTTISPAILISGQNLCTT